MKIELAPLPKVALTGVMASGIIICFHFSAELVCQFVFTGTEEPGTFLRFGELRTQSFLGMSSKLLNKASPLEILQFPPKKTISSFIFCAQAILSPSVEYLLWLYSKIGIGELSCGASCLQALTSQDCTSFPLLGPIILKCPLQQPPFLWSFPPISLEVLYTLSCPWQLSGIGGRLLLWSAYPWNIWQGVIWAFPRLYIFLLMQTFQRYKAWPHITVINRIVFGMVEEIFSRNPRMSF